MLPSHRTPKIENKTFFEQAGTDFDLINELLNQSTAMEMESSHYDLTQIGSPSTPLPVEETFSTSPVSQTGELEDLTNAHLWDFDGIEYEDLLLPGKKEKGEDFSSSENELLCMTSEALFGEQTNLNLANLICAQPAEVMPKKQLHYVVAPFKVQQPVPPKTPASSTATSSHKRKETLFPRALPPFPSEDEDVKPTLSNLPCPNPIRGRKRTSSTTSNKSVLKKPKKYEQDPAVDPTVKNAQAAKANRDRKKQELTMLQEASALKDQLIQQLQERLEKEEREKEQLRKERDAARESNIMIQGLRGVATNIREFLQCILPPMNSAFGRMDVHIPEWFEGVSLEGGAMTGIDPSVQARFGLQPNEEPSRFFTAHVNIPENQMQIEYNPRAPSPPRSSQNVNIAFQASGG